MSGDVTYQALDRLTYLPTRDALKNGNCIAGQSYYDIYFTGGTIGGINFDGFTSPNQWLNALLPVQAGQSGKALVTDGTNASWAAGGGGGGVSTVSVVTANGVSGSVANPTTTPAITLTLGDITPSSISTIGKATLNGGLSLNLISIISGASYSTIATDNIILVNKGSGSVTGITLNPGGGGGARTMTIKDAKGDAATNNITLTPASGTIDGASTFVINTNFGSATVAFDNTNWFVI